MWDKFRQSVANVSEQDRRRALLVSVPALIAIGGVAAMSQWAVWATLLFAATIVVLGAFFVATGLALRGR